jgi:tetratricopeptide (TPR) repeat protein
MDTKQVIARFEAERQALALMDHPNVAKVLDAGTTDSGRPYFVMELVHGVPITNYCDRNKLTPRERLELFVQVCRAVQHAHTKGMIHRDLKPTNVLVTLHDGVAVPKVIDFGIAKAMGQQLTERTLFTNFAQMVGTPLYMSPEQAEMSGLDVDTRSDIYSLGVLLYELLTGTTPFDPERLKQAAYDEVRRIIREEEPPRPSTRLSTLGEKLATVSEHCKTDPRRLGQLVRGELDWIVMKALEKDRARRYETADGLAADVRRYLNGEVVQACPPTPFYRFRKFARRKRATLTLVVTLALAALVAVGSIGWAAGQLSARKDKLNGAVELAIRDAETAREQALSHTDNPYRWEAALVAALSAIRRGEELADQDQKVLDEKLGARLRTLRSTLDADERDRIFITGFDQMLRGVVAFDARRSRFQSAQILVSVAEAFKTNYAIHFGQTPAAQVAQTIKSRPQPVREHLLAALDVCLARAPDEQAETRKWLAAVVEAADTDTWRKQARQALASKDWAALERIADDPSAARQLPVQLHLFMTQVPRDAETAKERLNWWMQEADPGEFWAPSRYYQASAYDLLAWYMATADPELRREEWALEWALKAVKIVPNDANFWNTLGACQYRVRNWTAAIAALEKAMELTDGGDGGDWLFLAMAQWQLGHKEQARQWYAKAVDWLAKGGRQADDFRRFQTEAAELLEVKK